MIKANSRTSHPSDTDIKVSVCIDGVWFDALDIYTSHRDGKISNRQVTVAYSVLAGILSFKPDLMKTLQLTDTSYSPRERMATVQVTDILSLDAAIPLDPSWECHDCHKKVYGDECIDTYAHRKDWGLEWSDHICNTCGDVRALAADEAERK